MFTVFEHNYDEAAKRLMGISR